MLFQFVSDIDINTSELYFEIHDPSSDPDLERLSQHAQPQVARLEKSERYATSAVYDIFGEEGSKSPNCKMHQY